MPNNRKSIRETFIAMQTRYKPIKLSELLKKYKNSPNNNLSITPEFNEDDFRCPLTGELILNDPVVLNGNIYERDALEDWIFQSDWLDPMFIFNKKDVNEELTQDVIQEN